MTFLSQGSDKLENRQDMSCLPCSFNLKLIPKIAIKCRGGFEIPQHSAGFFYNQGCNYLKWLLTCVFHRGSLVCLVPCKSIQPCQWFLNIMWIHMALQMQMSSVKITNHQSSQVILVLCQYSASVFNLQCVKMTECQTKLLLPFFLLSVNDCNMGGREYTVYVQIQLLARPIQYQ